MQAAAEQGAGFVAAADGQHLYLDAQPLAQLRNGHIVQEGILLFPQHDGRDAQRPALQAALALGDDVGGRHKTGHADIAAKELVLDGVDRDLDHRVLAVKLVHHLTDEGGCHGARDHIQLLGAVDAVRLFQLGQKLFAEQAHHAHAVFQLVVVFIELRRWDGPPCLEIPLVAGVDDPLAVATLALIAERFQNVDDSSARLGVVGHLRVEVLAVVRHTAGHGGYALHHRGQFQQVGQGAAQLIAVVDAPAEHQLAVDGNAALHQAGQVLKHLAAAPVGQHPDAELGVGGVDRNVDRRDVHLDDAVDLMVLHVRHGDIVAEQKGQALVVILEVKALAHTGGHLVDEAEHAVVGAGVLLVAEVGVEIAAKGAALLPADIPFPDAIRHLCLQVKAPAVGIKIVVQRVIQFIVVHAQQLVAGLQAQRLGFAPLFNALDLDRHSASPAFSASGQTTESQIFRTFVSIQFHQTSSDCQWLPLWGSWREAPERVGQKKKGKALRHPLLNITPMCHQFCAN